jgi:hypothetical protein
MHDIECGRIGASSQPDSTRAGPCSRVRPSSANRLMSVYLGDYADDTAGAEVDFGGTLRSVE